MSEVVATAEEILASSGVHAERVEQDLDFGIHGPNPSLSGAARKVVAFFEPRAVPGRTVMLANVVDGWVTLATAISRGLGCKCWHFFVAPEAAFPRTGFILIDAGAYRRAVSVQRDSRWLFYQEGVPLAEEVVALYEKRAVKDRLAAADVLGLASRVGYPLSEEEFWHANRCVYFREAESG